MSEPDDAAPRAFTLSVIALAPESAEPPARGGATLTQVESDGGGVYLIGGANRDAQCFSDVHRFDLSTRTWTLVSPARGSDAFPARSGHSAVALDHYIVVFGGLDLRAGKVFNDVFIFDTRSHEWTQAQIADGEVPLPRNAHAAVLLSPPPLRGSTETAPAPRHRMVVFGGSSPDDGAMADVFVLALPSDLAAVCQRQEALAWERIEGIAGESPEARELHCATHLPQTATICFSGGRNAAGDICSDVALLDAATWCWTLVPICAWNRCAHVAGLVQDAVVSFGGFDGSALRGDCWVYADAIDAWVQAELLDSSASKTAGAQQQPTEEVLSRFGHAGCAVALRVAERSDAATKTATTALLVFGGMTATQDLSDLVLIQAQEQSN